LYNSNNFFFFFQTNHLISFPTYVSYIFNGLFFIFLKKLLKLYKSCIEVVNVSYLIITIVWLYAWKWRNLVCRTYIVFYETLSILRCRGSECVGFLSSLCGPASSNEVAFEWWDFMGHWWGPNGPQRIGHSN
jgi:hypothetical protein